MATKQEPVQKTFRFPLIGTFQNRNALGTQDQRFINFFPESIKNAVTDNKKIYLVKRPGLALSYQLAAGVGRGMYGWNGFNYAVVGDKVYKDSTLLITLTTSTGHVGFTEATNATGTVLFMHDGTYGYVIYDDDSYIRIPETLSAWAGTTAYIASDRIIPTVDNGFYYSPTVGGVSAGSQPTWPTTIGSTVTDGTITWECMGYYDPDGLPKNALPYPVYLDGSIFLIARRTDGSNSQSIFNSDIDNPLSWGSNNFIDAESYPDNLVALARQNNMIIALGTTSGEFFYNGVNTTSPLAPNESLTLQMGCIAPTSVAQQERFCMFVGQSGIGGTAVWLLDGFAPNKVSDEYIEKMVDAEIVAGGADNITGYSLRTVGHFFYILNLPTTDRTLVYDLEEKMWHEWSSNDADSHVMFVGKYASDAEDGQNYIQDATTGAVYLLSATTYQDNSTDILAEAITTKYDFESMNRKFMSSLNVVGDLVSGDTIDIRWSDDDYNTWSNWKTISLTSRPIFARLGSFRRRAFDVLYTGNHLYRIESLEVDVSLGTH